MEAYRKYAPALLRKAERILQNRSDAEDVVQGLFYHLMQRPEMSLDLPYLYRATTNRCLNFLRDRRRHARLLERQDVMLRGPVRTRLDDRAIDLDLLLKLVGRLDARVAEVLLCHFYDDMSQEEIAAHTGLSRKTIGRYLEKIRRAARAFGEEEGARHE